LLPGNVVFDTGKAVLSPAPENQVILNQLKQFLIDNPRVSTVRIEGYTDNVGQAAANLKLSGERALAIKQWLIANGIAAERVMAVGFGQEKPIADNSTAAGRAQNRRTELVRSSSEFGDLAVANIGRSSRGCCRPAGGHRLLRGGVPRGPRRRPRMVPQGPHQQRQTRRTNGPG
jgi:hypothetical protein